MGENRLLAGEDSEGIKKGLDLGHEYSRPLITKNLLHYYNKMKSETIPFSPSPKGCALKQ